MILLASRILYATGILLMRKLVRNSCVGRIVAMRMLSMRNLDKWRLEAY